jgi:hypothetical protein
MLSVITFLTQASKSKTIMVNVMLVAVSALAAVHGHEVMVQYPEVVAAVGAVMGGLNVALRFLTTKPVSQK